VSALRTYDEAADYLRISRSLLERIVQRREISCVRVGARVLFTDADLEAFIDAKRVEPTVAAPRPAVRRGGRASGPNLTVIGSER
jgi:excisionase family DNA binding protein